jgi:hypothetical protein
MKMKDSTLDLISKQYHNYRYDTNMLPSCNTLVIDVLFACLLVVTYHLQSICKHLETTFYYSCNTTFTLYLILHLALFHHQAPLLRSHHDTAFGSSEQA